MLLSSAKHFSRKVFLERRVLSGYSTTRFKSSSVQETDEELPQSYAFDENGEAAFEVVSFPAGSRDSKQVDSKPVLLNAKEHAVGYLSKILNARVYEAAIETDLQEAKNLSSVRP
jgi:hypothetical protein